MKKILVIGTVDNMGGAARVGWDIATNIPKNKYDVKFIVGKKTTDSKNVYELKGNSTLRKVDDLTGKNIYALSKHLLSFVLANDIDRGASSEILNHPWYKGADIVHCHNLHGNYFKLDTLSVMSNEKPVIWTLHDMWSITAHCAHCYECKNYNNGKHFTPGIGRYGCILWDNSEYLWNQKRKIYRGSKNLTIVCPSQWLANLVKRGILEDKKIKVINNGIDTKVFTPGKKSILRKELKLPIGKKVVAYVAQWGMIDRRKGGKFFLDVAKKYERNNGVLFLCIGGITGTKPERKGNIIFVPYIKEKKQLSKYYSASDMLLFTSLAENFPLVTLEALACGLPVVSFDVGGVKEQVVSGTNGLIVEYKNAQMLMDLTEKILTTPQATLNKMSVRNTAKANKKYSIQKMVNSYAKLYETLA